MNILFITLFDIKNAKDYNIYTDLMREIADKGHNVYIASSVERRFGLKTGFVDSQYEGGGSIRILKVKTGNLQKTNLIEKGISTFLFEWQFCKGIQKHLKDIAFDLVLYSTPPITQTKVIRRLKKKYDATTYLLLKDIFPQNAVDLGMFQKKHCCISISVVKKNNFMRFQITLVV